MYQVDKVEITDIEIRTKDFFSNANKFYYERVFPSTCIDLLSSTNPAFTDKINDCNDSNPILSKCSKALW